MKLVIDIPHKYFTEDFVGVTLNISGLHDIEIFAMAYYKYLSGKVIDDLHSYVLKENQTLVVNREGVFNSDAYNEPFKRLIKRAIALSLEATSHDYSITEIIDIIDKYPIDRMGTIFDRYEDEMVKSFVKTEETKSNENDQSIKADHIESPYVDDQTIKSDDGKLKLSLVPREIIRAIARARMYGLKKYGDKESWKSVSKERYIDALYRHFLTYLDDIGGVDEESGLLHTDHIAFNIAAICELEKGERDGRRIQT